MSDLVDRVREKRVVYIEEPNSEERQQVRAAQDEFWERNPGTKLSMRGGISMTYLFKTVDNAKDFGNLLEQKSVPFSYHPASEYDALSAPDNPLGLKTDLS